jgi:hypothetical protein
MHDKLTRGLNRGHDGHQFLIFFSSANDEQTQSRKACVEARPLRACAYATLIDGARGAGEARRMQKRKARLS